jgi:hypothetical protein
MPGIWKIQPEVRNGNAYPKVADRLIVVCPSEYTIPQKEKSTSQKLLINQNSMPALLTTDCSSIFNHKVFSQRMQTCAHGRCIEELLLPMKNSNQNSLATASLNMMVFSASSSKLQIVSFSIVSGKKKCTVISTKRWFCKLNQITKQLLGCNTLY